MYQFIYLFTCLLGLGLPALSSKKYLPFSELTPYCSSASIFSSVDNMSCVQWFNETVEIGLFSLSEYLFFFYSTSYYAVVPVIAFGFFILWLRNSRFISFSQITYPVLQLTTVMSTSLWLFICAFYISSFHLATVVNQQLPDDLVKKDLVITGTVIGLPKQNNNYSQFYFLVNTLSLLDENSVMVEQSWGKSKKIRLSWRSYELVRSGGVKPGQKYQLLVRLKKPRGMVNEKGFDYQAWLLRKGVRATGYVKSYKKSKVSDNAKPPTILGNAFAQKERMPKNIDHFDDVSYSVFQSPLDIRIFISVIRFNIAEYLDVFSERYSYVSIFKALVIGDKRDVTNHQWNVFSNTGTIHLMAISGLHVGLVAASAFFISSYFCKLLRFFSLRISYQVLRSVPSLCSILFSVFYALLAGVSIPTQRAMIVVILINIAIIFDIKTSFIRILLISALLIAALDPFSFIQAGFWLSFLAVCILIYAFSSRLNKASWLSIFVLTQVVVFLGLFVGLRLLNLPISGTSILANCFAVPVVSFVILPGLFIFLIISPFSSSLGDIILSLCDTSFHILMRFLEYLNGWDLSYRLSSIDFSIILVVGFFSVLFLLSPKGLQLRTLGSVLFLAILIENNSEIDELNFSALDVGQGLSVVVQEKLYGNHASSTLVYDVGAKFSDSFDIGSRIVVPFLQSRGIDHVENLIISHLDNDHAGGFEGFVSGISVGQVVSGQANDLRTRFVDFADSKNTEENNVRIQGIDIKSCHSAFSNDGYRDTQSISGMQVEVLWPTFITDYSLPKQDIVDNHYLGDIKKRNNFSCVVLIRYAGKTILMMGDAEAKVEKYLLRSGVLPKNIDVLVAGHHGSNTSSIKAFVDHTNPNNVIFSAGYKNSYRHPADKVVNRFLSKGTKVYNTGIDGQINFHIDKSGSFKVTSLRKQLNKRWY